MKSDIPNNVKKLAEKYPHPEDKVEQDKFIPRIRTLETYQDYSKHPITEQLAAECKKRMLDNGKKIMNEKTPDDVRREAFSENRAYRWILEIVARNYKRDIQAIEDEIERLLTT